MNAAIFWRIFWKEYRAQRAFWISIAVSTLAVELFMLVIPWETEVQRIQALFATAFGLAAAYALGSGATLFATEREAETYDFLRALPVKPLEVFAGKVAFALASTAALFLTAWTLALALAGGLPEPRFHQQIWAVCGLGGLDFLVWGVLFSLLLKRPLMAAIFAGICAPNMLALIMTMNFDPRIVPGGLLVALLTVVDIALATRWFRERLFIRARTRSAQSPDFSEIQSALRPRLSEEQIEAIFDRYLPWRLRAERATEATGSASNSSPSASTMLGGLLWQEWRQSAVMTAALIIMLLPTILCLLMAWLSWGKPANVEPWSDDLLPALVYAGLSVTLLGSSLFLADQMGCRFRFLAEHGIPPRLVWLSRQIRGVVILLLVLLLVLPPMVGLIAAHHPSENLLFGIECVVGFAIVAYACGQFCSMTIRSGIVAATSGTVLTFLLCGWTAIMYFFGLSWLWSVAPLPLAFLVATWLHAPNWLLERKTWRTWLRPALVVAVSTLAIVVAIPLVRVYEIPLVSPGFDVAELTRPVSAEEKETLAIYERAIELEQRAADGGKTPADEPARRKAEEQAVTLALEASRRPLSASYLDLDAAPNPCKEISLADLVLANGKRLQSAGKLDAALDHYMAAVRIALHVRRGYPWLASAQKFEIRVCEQLTNWAAQSGQKPQQVLAALRTMEKQSRNPLTCCDDIKNYGSSGFRCKLDGRPRWSPAFRRNRPGNAA